MLCGAVSRSANCYLPALPNRQTIRHHYRNNYNSVLGLEILAAKKEKRISDKMGSEMGEKFCLRWNDFENSISGAFRELRDQQDFFDVTIACEDNQIEAHKVILSACSPFFRSILKRNPHQHPLLYLNKVKYDCIVAVLNFMYHGEVNVAQDDLSTFLAVAEDLKVKGLTQNDQNQSKQNQASPPKRSAEAALSPTSESSSKKQKVKKDIEYPELGNSIVQIEDEVEEVPSDIKTEPEPIVVEEPDPFLQEHLGSDHDYREGNAGFSHAHFQLQDQNRVNPLARVQDQGNANDVDFDQFVTQNTSRVPGTTNIQCHFCSKITIHVGNMKQHFDSNHYHGDYKCDTCQKNFKTKKSLLKHQKNLGHLNLGEQMMYNMF